MKGFFAIGCTILVMVALIATGLMQQTEKPLDMAVSVSTTEPGTSTFVYTLSVFSVQAQSATVRMFIPKTQEVLEIEGSCTENPCVVLVDADHPATIRVRAIMIERCPLLQTAAFDAQDAAGNRASGAAVVRASQCKTYFPSVQSEGKYK